MAKTLEQYLRTYLKILDVSNSDVTVPPQYWVFSMWERDTGAAEGTPEQAIALLERVENDDPALYAVIQHELGRHLDAALKQKELQQQGANIIEITVAGQHHEVMPIEQARAEAESLL